MASKKPSPPQQANLSVEQTALETQIKGTLTSVFGHDTVEYRHYAHATQLDHGSIYMSLGGHVDSGRLARQYVAEGKIDAIRILNTAIKWLEDEIKDAEDSAGPTVPSLSLSSKVFV